MKGDFSRRTHDPRKHYSAVLAEQGRLLTDADLEEEHRILSGLHERATADLIGGCGGPIHGAGFKIGVVDGDLRVSAGRYYADGVLVVNDAEIKYPEQPHRAPEVTEWPPTEGRYVVVLDVWRRLVTALDDASIREVALGGPSTTAREQTVWQVRHLAVPDDWTCDSELPPGPTTTGGMAARAQPEPPAATPCLVPPLAGFTGLENQFYRVEVITAGAAVDVASAQQTPVVGFPDGPTNQVELAPDHTLNPGTVIEFVTTGQNADPLDSTYAQVAAVDGAVVTLTSDVPPLAPGESLAVRAAEAAVVISRDNGAVVTSIAEIAGADITVADLGPDDVLGFAPGQWVEVIDDAIEYEPELPRRLHRIASVDVDDRVITLRTPVDPALAPDPGVDPARHPKLRRWDGARAIVFDSNGDSWIHVENGIQLRFSAGDYARDDYWHFPARTAVIDDASGNIEWPQNAPATPADLPPFGIVHHRCSLALLVVDAAGVVTPIDDCRALFPPVSELTNLLYVGGDGQESRAGTASFPMLPSPLTVRVANGSHPVAGATVRFTGPGALLPPDVQTDADGIATTEWRLDPGLATQSCDAHLLDAAGNPIPHQVVRFSASIEQEGGGGQGGCCVSVGPGGRFERIDEAVKVLLDSGERHICLCLIPGDHELGDLQLPAPEDPRGRPGLTIRGCGRGTRVLVHGGIHLRQWASLQLRDFDLVLRRGTSLLADRVADVSLQGMHVIGLPTEQPLIRLHDAQRIRVESCVLEPHSERQFERWTELFGLLPRLRDVFPNLDTPDYDNALLESATAIAELEPDDRSELAVAWNHEILQTEGELHPPVAARFLAFGAFLASPDRLAGTAIAAADAINALRPAVAINANLVALEIGAGEEGQQRFGEASAVVRATVHLDGNVILGNVSFYGGPEGKPLNRDHTERLEGRLAEADRWEGLSGSVQMRDNHLHRLLVGETMMETMARYALGDLEAQPPTLYESFLLTGNIVEGTASAVVAVRVALNGNDFPIGAGRRLALLQLIADTATLTGNIGGVIRGGAAGPQPLVIDVTTRAVAEAGNVELAIS